MAKTTSPKTTRTTRTRRANPDDVAFLQMIERCAALWSDSNQLDDKTIPKLRKSGADPAQIAELRARMDKLIHDACALERQIAATKIFTAEGYAAKAKFLAEAAFDAEEARVFAFLLGRDAERIGITAVAPGFIAKPLGRDKSFKGEAKRANYLAAKALRTYRAKRAAAVGAAQAEAATA
jgi:hypothetical protein